MKALLLTLLLLTCLPLWGGVAEPAPERWEIVTKLFIGVESRSLTSEEKAAHGIGLPSGSGLLVTRVVPGSPAEKGGLREGDVIVMLSAALLDSPADLLHCMRNYYPGIPMFFDVLRGEEMQHITIVPEERPEPAVVGYLTPPQLHAGRVDAIRPRQARVARLLAQAQIPLAELNKELESIYRLLNKSSTVRGNLRLSFSAQGCTFTVMCYWKHLLVTMEEKGTRSSHELKQEGDALPEAMRYRLTDMLEQNE